MGEATIDLPVATLDDLNAMEARIMAAIAAIPITPLLANDTRLNHLDADISSRSTFAGGTVASVTAPVSLAVTPPTAAEIDAALTAAHGSGSWSGVSLETIEGSTLLAKEATVASRLAAVDYTEPPTAAAVAHYVWVDSSDRTLTSTPGLTQAEHDQLMATALEITAQGVKSKTDNLPADPAGVSDVQVSVIPDYSAVASAVLDAISADHRLPGTTGELISRLATPDNAPHVVVVPAPDNPANCLIVVDMLDLGLTPVAGATIQVKGDGIAGLNGYLITPNTDPVTTDENGRAVLQVAKGMKVNVHIKGLTQWLPVDTADHDTIILANTL